MLHLITEPYDYYIGSQEDPRVKGFPLMSSPKIAIILCTLYLIFVKYIGPAYMKNRKPLEINKIIVGYNALQMVFSLNMFIHGCIVGPHVINSIWCNPHKYKYDYYSLKAVDISWWFLVGRFTEFLDTIFFILRKKNNQVSTLHVVHHFAVPLICWVGVKIVPGSQYTFAGFLNSFVHTFMYLYYMIAAMGPEYKKYLWWKKYMTVLQLAQFVIVILHTIYTLASGCEIAQVFGYLILGQAVIFFGLFWNFYTEAFKGKSEKKLKDSKPLFDIEKYYNRYRSFFEMCIPNQQVLYEDDDIQEGQKLGSNLDVSKDDIIKENLEKPHLE